MSSLRTVRDDLAAALADDAYTVEPVMPDQLHPPLVLMAPADPYIVTSSTSDTPVAYGEALIQWDLYLIPEQGYPADTYANLDDMIETVIQRADLSAEWDLGEVRAPYTLTSGGTSYLITTLTLTRPTTFKE